MTLLKSLGLVCLVFILFTMSFVIADNHEFSTDFDYTDNFFDSDYVSDIDWSDQLNWDTYYDEYPTEAFAYDSDQAWAEIESDNSLMFDADTRAAAFENDPLRAVSVLNNNPEYLDDPEIFTDFDTALLAAREQDVLDSEYDPDNANTQSEMLNNNPAVKVKWLQKAFGIDMRDSSVDLTDYTGNSITSSGEGGLTFDPRIFSGETWINEDGSLGTKGAQYTGGTLQQTDMGELEFAGGIVQLSTDLDEGYSVRMQNNAEVVVLDSSGDPEKGVTYSGTFTYEKQSGSELISGDFTVFSDDVLVFVDGTLENQVNSPSTDFILVGDTKITTGDTVIDVIAVGNTKVYYTESDARSAGSYCDPSFSCIVNSAGEGSDPGNMDRLSIIGLRDVEKISVETTAYYSHVEVIDLQEGEVDYTSLSKDATRMLGNFVVGAADDIKIRGNDLSSVMAGRVDVQYTDSASGEEILHHWSSNKYQKDTGYFRGQGSMASCVVSVDCDAVLAQSFGKVITDGGQTPSTTVILGGDNSYTARNMEGWCRSNGGCYIINSRDTPTKISSEHLVVTGHHYVHENKIWRDDIAASDGAHYPIDKLYFNGIEGSSPYDHLPVGENVESVTFSACNTVDSGGQGIHELSKTYPRLQQVQGWDGTAPFYEQVGELGKDIDTISDSAPKVYVNSGGKESTQAYYFKDGDDWLYTRDGITCQRTTGYDSQPCVPTVVDNSGD